MAHPIRSASCWFAGGIGFAVTSYAAYVGFTWLRYGHPPNPTGEDADPLLDQFIPGYEVVERHHVLVAAPAGITMAAACDMDLQQSLIVSGIVKGRELILAGGPASRDLAGLVPRSRLFVTIPSRSRGTIRLQTDMIVDRIAETLLAPEVSLCRLN